MILTLDTERLRTLSEVRAFLDGNHPVDFRPVDRDDAYGFVRRTLVRFFAADASRYVTGEVVAVDGGMARVGAAPRPRK